jgi:hypothetical protein
MDFDFFNTPNKTFPPLGKMKGGKKQDGIEYICFINIEV